MLAPQLATAATSSETRLAEALELLSQAYGVRPPAATEPSEVVVFLAEAVAALALDRKTLKETRQGSRTTR